MQFTVSRTLLAGTARSSNTESYLELSNHHMQFRVEASSPAIVSVAQAYYHCWSAKVDDHPAPLARANHGFQAVFVPAGRHRVPLVYRDPHFLSGAIISVLSLALYGVARYVTCSRKFL